MAKKILLNWMIYFDFLFTSLIFLILPVSPSAAHNAHIDIIKNATSFTSSPYSGDVNVSIDRVYISDSLAS